MKKPFRTPSSLTLSSSLHLPPQSPPITPLFILTLHLILPITILNIRIKKRPFRTRKRTTRHHTIHAMKILLTPIIRFQSRITRRTTRSRRWRRWCHGSRHGSDGGGTWWARDLGFPIAILIPFVEERTRGTGKGRARDLSGDAVVEFGASGVSFEAGVAWVAG